MIDNKAVMQQALDAIRNSIPTPLSIDGSWELRKKAIEGLEANIAQPEQTALSKQTIEKLHKFLDAAAGDGLVCDGVDAADLYIEIFPEQYAAGTT